jgi:predicted DNA-binding transcriptional regulator AlpA
VAAEYVGVSPSKFDELVRVGQLPKPKRIGARVLWDRHAVDAAFANLPGDNDNQDCNPWDLG